MSYLHRLVEEEFRLTAQTMRIVLVSGPRQCGKTTLLKAMLRPGDLFLSFDDEATREAAASDPVAFFRPYLKKYQRIAIDEVQKVPTLFAGMKMIVDEEPIPGRFLISGSSNYQALPGVNESLAGRLGEVRLKTMTASEIAGTDKANLIERWVDADWGQPIYSIQECSKDVVLEKALSGGYPEICLKDSRSRKIWFENYIDRLLEHDLKEIGQFEKTEALRKLLSLLSSQSSRTTSVNELSKAVNLQGTTLNRYLGALKTMYLIDEVPAWSKKTLVRLAKSPNRYISDSGLMSALLGHSELRTLNAWVMRTGKVGTDFIGNLVETWVFNQLSPIARASGGWKIFHLRLSQRQEIDFVLENDFGEQILIEVKASETVTADDFKHIEWFMKNNPQTALRGIVLYCGQAVRNFAERCTALPMATFWMD